MSMDSKVNHLFSYESHHLLNSVLFSFRVQTWIFKEQSFVYKRMGIGPLNLGLFCPLDINP